MTTQEKLAKVRESLIASKKDHFHVDGDNWYSCSAHPECGDESRAGKECDCGADKHNRMVEDAITVLDSIQTAPSDAEVRDAFKLLDNVDINDGQNTPYFINYQKRYEKAVDIVRAATAKETK